MLLKLLITIAEIALPLVFDLLLKRQSEKSTGNAYRVILLKERAKNINIEIKSLQ